MKIVKTLLLTCFFATLTSPAFSASGFSCGEGNNCTVDQSSAGKNGTEVCKDSKNVVRRKAVYKDNALNGLWECFDEKGQLLESRNYKNDKLNGLTRRFKADIFRFEEVNYSDDEFDGSVQVFQTGTSNGKTTVTGSVITQYKKGNQHGFQVFYDKDGKEKRRICFQDDRMKEDNPELCGGQVIPKKEEAKKEDPYKGWKTSLFPSKKIKEKYLLLGYGDYEEYQSFFENGKTANHFKRTAKGDLAKPDIYSVEMYDDVGKLTSKGSCKIFPGQEFMGDYCYTFSGTRFSYDDEGLVLNKSSYLDGKLDGESIEYDRGKKTESILIYEKDVKTKWIKKNSVDGSVIKTEEYYPDGSRK